MVDRLRVMMATIEKLPAEQQEALANAIEELLDEQEWDAFIASEKGADLIAQVRANYEREKRDGTIIEGDW